MFVNLVTTNYPLFASNSKVLKILVSIEYLRIKYNRNLEYGSKIALFICRQLLFCENGLIILNVIVHAVVILILKNPIGLAD